MLYKVHPHHNHTILAKRPMKIRSPWVRRKNQEVPKNNNVVKTAKMVLDSPVVKTPTVRNASASAIRRYVWRTTEIAVGKTCTDAASNKTASTTARTTQAKAVPLMP